jgi:hypothetical protein
MPRHDGGAFFLRGLDEGDGCARKLKTQQGAGLPPTPKEGNETAAEKLLHEFSHPCRALHGWFIFRVLMLHSNQVFAEVPCLGREHG